MVAPVVHRSADRSTPTDRRSPTKHEETYGRSPGRRPGDHGGTPHQGRYANSDARPRPGCNGRFRQTDEASRCTRRLSLPPAPLDDCIDGLSPELDTKRRARELFGSLDSSRHQVEDFRPRIMPPICGCGGSGPEPAHREPWRSAPAPGPLLHRLLRYRCRDHRWRWPNSARR